MPFESDRMSAIPMIPMLPANTVIMVRTVRLLVAQMEKEGMKFPLHLGVTEAGEGEDGERIFPTVTLNGPNASKGRHRFDLDCQYKGEEEE